jgi:hypothetical protein
MTTLNAHSGKVHPASAFHGPPGQARGEWDTYSAAIERHVGAKLSNKDAAQLCDLLGRWLDRLRSRLPFPRPRD